MSFSWVILYIFQYVSSSVNVMKNGETKLCNFNPKLSYDYMELNDNDKLRINKLEQIQVLIRHGSRTGDLNFKKLFPNSTENYHCNINTIETRHISMLQNNPYMEFKKIYQNNHINTNCHGYQSLSYMINQHTQNSDLIYENYFNNNNSYMFNMDDISLDDIVVRASDMERTIGSASVFMKNLFDKLGVSVNGSVHDIITEDYDIEGYHSGDDCQKDTQYSKWNALYADMYWKNIENRDAFEATGNELLEQWKSNGNPGDLSAITIGMDVLIY